MRCMLLPFLKCSCHTNFFSGHPGFNGQKGIMGRYGKVGPSGMKGHYSLYKCTADVVVLELIKYNICCVL